MSMKTSFLTRAFALVVIPLLLAFPLIAASDDIQTITVSGEAKVSQVPDRFHFTVTLEEKGLYVSKLNKAISSKSERIVKQLLESEIKEEDIQSLHVQLNPWYEYTNNQREHKGFVLTRQIRVNVKEVEKFDFLIDMLIKAGASGIDGFRYSLSQPRMSYLDALDLAVTDARFRAEKLAYSVDAQVGKVISIRELGSRGDYAPVREKAMLMADSHGGYMPGQIDITAYVEVIFELKN